MKVTREMIGAAHDVCLKKGDFVLSADLLERLYSAMYERSQEKAERDELKTALKFARNEVASWGLYATEYFQKKHDLAGSIDRIDAALAKGEKNG